MLPKEPGRELHINPYMAGPRARGTGRAGCAGRRCRSSGRCPPARRTAGTSPRARPRWAASCPGLRVPCPATRVPARHVGLDEARRAGVDAQRRDARVRAASCSCWRTPSRGHTRSPCRGPWPRTPACHRRSPGTRRRAPSAPATSTWRSRKKRWRSALHVFTKFGPAAEVMLTMRPPSGSRQRQERLAHPTHAEDVRLEHRRRRRPPADARVVDHRVERRRGPAVAFGDLLGGRCHRRSLATSSSSNSTRSAQAGRSPRSRSITARPRAASRDPSSTHVSSCSSRIAVAIAKPDALVRTRDQDPSHGFASLSGSHHSAPATWPRLRTTDPERRAR